MKKDLSRRSFIASSSIITGSILLSPLPRFTNNLQDVKKLKIALVGTGIRALDMWSKSVVEEYGDRVEFVGISDINPGRLEYFKKRTGLKCQTFIDFDKMMKQTRPDMLIVTTVDSTHHDFIIKGLEYGADILTEKPLTTDEDKCQAILDAEKKSGKKVIVTFNYRYSPHRAKMYELIRGGEIGDITSVDFHWYLDTSHGADYFRRWHRLKEKGGTLWVHKATHHFDLLNWWIGSDPEEVYASGALDHYGKNNSFRHTHCRPCPHKDKCNFYYDINKTPQLKELYADHENHDGYLRDGCVWREDINIYDKMAATIKYVNGVQVSYSLTTYSPYEGYRIAFNGTKGRIDAWIEESNPIIKKDYDEIVISRNFGEREILNIPHSSGHGGGDKLLKDSIFKDVKEDPLQQTAGIRDGAFSILIGIAARKSCETGMPVKIDSLTTLKPEKVRKV